MRDIKSHLESINFLLGQKQNNKLQQLRKSVRELIKKAPHLSDDIMAIQDIALSTLTMRLKVLLVQDAIEILEVLDEQEFWHWVENEKANPLGGDVSHREKSS